MIHNTDSCICCRPDVDQCWDLKDTTCIEGQGSTKTNDSIS